MTAADYPYRRRETEVAATKQVDPPRWAVWAAYAVPLCVLPSAVWRLGTLVPMRHVLSPSEFLYVPVLSALSLLLGYLTVGLVRPWGEVFPRWLPVLGGRPVPARPVVAVAASGASLIALLMVYALGKDALGITVQFQPVFGSPHPEVPDPSTGEWAWLAKLCYAPLLAWSPLLAAVTVSYHRRRRDAAGGT